MEAAACFGIRVMPTAEVGMRQHRVFALVMHYAPPLAHSCLAQWRTLVRCAALRVDIVHRPDVDLGGAAILECSRKLAAVLRATSWEGSHDTAGLAAGMCGLQLHVPCRAPRTKPPKTTTNQAP